MALSRVKGPGIKVLDQPLKSISEFETFRHSLIFSLRQDDEFRPYLKPGLKFGVKTNGSPYRDLRDDAGSTETPPTAGKLTAEAKCEIVDFLLETIAQYCPRIPQIDIVNCGSLDAVWQLIRLHSNIETTGALLNSVWNVTRQPDETPQALWSRLRQQYDDALIRKDTLVYTDAKLTADERMSPTLHNVIILHWLQIIHPKLRDMVTQRFSKELRDATYASIWPEISRSIDSFLQDLSENSSPVCRYDSNSSYNTPRYSESNRSPWRGKGFSSRPRGFSSHRPQSTSKQCDYCRITGRRAYYNHSIDECLFLKKERPASSKAVEVEEQYDEHYEEFLEAYNQEPDVGVNAAVNIINRVSTDSSPVLSLYNKDKVYQLTLDTGGTINVIDSQTARNLECVLHPTLQRARMADGETDLEVKGKTVIMFSRKKKSFKFSALVCKMAGPTILAGMPFMIQHDIGIRPAKSEIILDGVDSIIYDSKSESLPTTRCVSSYTIRSPSKTVVLPGEEIKFNLPAYLHNESSVAVEPRYDNSYQASTVRPWPNPQVHDVKEGDIVIKNSSTDPVQLVKNQHICNIQIPVSDTEVDKVIAQSPIVQSLNSKPADMSTKKTTLYSAPVNLNPDDVLSPEQAAKFSCLLQEYDEVFNPVISTYNQKSGRCFVEVNMGPVPPPQHKGKVPFYGRNNLIELQEKFDVMVSKGKLKRPQDIDVTVENLNTSFLVKKKDSVEKRLVTDFASIADYCRPTPTLMPDCDSTLRQISTWKYLIVSDLTEAYHQIPLKKSSMKYTGVVSPMKGVFVYTVGCMGLPGTEVALEELTNLLFGHMVMKGKVAKLADDLFIGGDTVEELLVNFEEVLGILLENNLKLKAKKTFIAPKSVVVLGWVWTNGSLQASPHKLSALSECEPPTTTKGLKSWIGAYRHLSRVVKDYGVVLLPLENMISGKYSKETAGSTKIVWTSEQIVAFKKAQSTLRDAKSIALPQPDDVLQIVTDAAVQPTAIGATLYVVRDGSPHLGGFFNAKLPPFQRRWLPCELEGVAIGIALSHFSPYILQSNHRPVVLTDSKACVDAVAKLNRGEYSASSRLCTFLSTVSRYGAIVKHIKGSSNLVSDFISRNPVSCKDPRCQVCTFIKDRIDSVVASITVTDVMEGKVNLPWINKGAWADIQAECPDLHNVVKYLQSGTTPGKKGRNCRMVKQYIRSKVIITAEGVLIVRQIEPFLPQTERIVVPQSVIHGVLTVLHIKLSHPSSYQLMKVFNRFFFALKLDAAATKVTNTCHQCSSLKDIPKSMHKESSDTAPDYITQKCATDVIKRNSQLVLVLRECVSSYTLAQLIPSETAADISTGLLALSNVMRPSAITPMVIRADPHPSHKSLFNNDSSILAKNNITLEIGRELNVNHNPVAEKAVREMIKELLIIQPEGGPITSTVLSKATASLNSRIRAQGVSAHEIFTQRDQNTGKQLSLDDLQLITEQQKRRHQNHKASEKCKSGGKPANPEAKVSSGSIVCLYSEGSKLRARPRYVVISVKEGWCTMRRFAEKRLGSITYSAKLSEVYTLQDETEPYDQLPAYPVHDELEDEPSFTRSGKPKQMKRQEVVEEVTSEEESSSEEEEDQDKAEEDIADDEAYCTVCHREVKNNQQGLSCDSCSQWSHRNCVNMTKKRYKELVQQGDFEWSCPACPPELQPRQEDVVQEDLREEMPERLPPDRV